MTKLFAIPLAAALACLTTTALYGSAGVQKADYGKMPNGTLIEQYTLTNSKGLTAKYLAK